MSRSAKITTDPVTGRPVLHLNSIDTLIETLDMLAVHDESKGGRALVELTANRQRSEKLETESQILLEDPLPERFLELYRERKTCNPWKLSAELYIQSMVFKQDLPIKSMLRRKAGTDKQRLEICCDIGDGLLLNSPQLRFRVRISGKVKLYWIPEDEKFAGFFTGMFRDDEEICAMIVAK